MPESTVCRSSAHSAAAIHPKPAGVPPSSVSLSPGSLIPRSHCQVFPHQVGGHFVNSASGMLKYRQFLLKPVGPSRKGQCEKDFYQCIHTHPPILKQFIPKFYGIVRVKGDEIRQQEEANENENIQHAVNDRVHSSSASSSSSSHSHCHELESEYIALEDLTEGFHSPCIMDLKMGTKTYDEEATREKAEGDKKKYSHQEILGMRVIGMKLYNSLLNQWIRYDKQWGRELHSHNFQDGLKQFFQHHASVVIPLLLERLEELLDWFQHQTEYRFYSSSLLIIYEGNCDPADLKPHQVRLCMVDFTHVYGPARSRFFSLHDDSLNNSGLHRNTNQRDEGYSHGLRTLIHKLKHIINEEKSN